MPTAATPCVMLVSVKSEDEDYLYEFESSGPANDFHQRLVGALRRRRAGKDEAQHFRSTLDGTLIDLDDVTCVRLASIWSVGYFDAEAAPPGKEVTPPRPPVPRPRPKSKQ